MYIAVIFTVPIRRRLTLFFASARSCHQALWLGCACFSLFLMSGCQKTEDVSKAQPESRLAPDAGPAEERMVVTPPVPAEVTDVYEDVTAKTGIQFVHQFCDQ